jgi:alpha-beta hydrolase superfamily lysophospholipase
VDTSPQPVDGSRRLRTLASRRCAVWMTAALALTTALIAAGPQAQAASKPPLPTHSTQSCTPRAVEVSLTEQADATLYHIRGWLCQPQQKTSTVQLLVAGMTYAHTYWTGPGGPDGGYVRSALTAGTAVFVFDRIGIGESDKPPADQVTLDAEATVAHQLVTALRDGELGRFPRVVGVGHSFGSIILQAETAAHHDLDRLVLTGLLHGLDLATEAAFAGDLYPAGSDPAYANAGLPTGYLTTKPGTRDQYFLDPATALPGAATWDEQTKATATTGELTLDLSRPESDSRQVHVPVLLVVGSADAIFCGAGLACTSGQDVCARERGFYPGAVLDAAVIADTGHSITLHRTATVAAAVSNSWITGRPPTPPLALAHCNP